METVGTFHYSMFTAMYIFTSLQFSELNDRHCVSMLKKDPGWKEFKCV